MPNIKRREILAGVEEYIRQALEFWKVLTSPEVDASKMLIELIKTFDALTVRLAEQSPPAVQQRVLEIIWAAAHPDCSDNRTAEQLMEPWKTILDSAPVRTAINTWSDQAIAHAMCYRARRGSTLAEAFNAVGQETTDLIMLDHGRPTRFVLGGKSYFVIDLKEDENGKQDTGIGNSGCAIGNGIHCAAQPCEGTGGEAGEEAKAEDDIRDVVEGERTDAGR